MEDCKIQWEASVGQHIVGLLIQGIEIAFDWNVSSAKGGQSFSCSRDLSEKKTCFGGFAKVFWFYFVYADLNLKLFSTNETYNEK